MEAPLKSGMGVVGDSASRLTEGPLDVSHYKEDDMESVVKIKVAGAL